MPEKKKLENIIRNLPPVDTSSVHDQCVAAVKKAHRKIVVLDDDPTGTQVVHDIPVYTEWGLDVIRQAFLESDRMFFILTNSRGMSAGETARVHQEIAARLLQVVRETQQDILLISRSDSTLRGHYPLETKVINDTWTAQGGSAFDGEIIVPFFPEGGRYTYENIHYVEQNGALIPAAETEFARDRTFPYSKSDLCEWIGEKTEGVFPAGDVCVFSVNDLRTLPAASHEEKLMRVSGFRKIVVNAVSYTDLELFVIPLMGAVLRGKKFLFRSAASLTKVLGLVSDRDLLEHETLTDGQNKNGGLIVVGSYVEKTTSQLMDLFNHVSVERMQFDVESVSDERKRTDQQMRLVRQIDKCLENRINVVLYTSRKRTGTSGNSGEADLMFSVQVSKALSEVVRNLSARPRFLLAKGGITSSDIATGGLSMKHAVVMGQILRGVPVWRAGTESKYPGLPYIVFPGNVGNESSLREAYEKLE